MDLGSALLLLVSLSWLILGIFLVYLVTWNWPAMFFQSRTGKDGVLFTMWKFRTLSLDERKTVAERRFAVGDFLRATSLDELPQLINILKGEMSLIGPRPLPNEYVPLLTEQLRARHSVRPGITGCTQVSDRHTLPWEKKFELDLYYVNNLTFWLDVKIAVKTIFVLLSFKKDISLEEKPFTGQ